MRRRIRLGPRARRAILVGAVLIAGLHFASFDIVRQPMAWDARFYLYFSARVAQGDVPYRDHFDNKTPLATYAGALLFRVANAFGGEPVYFIRAGSLFFAWLAGVALLAVHRRLGRGHLFPGLVALIVFCGFPLLGFLPSLGPWPKTLMVVFASMAGLLIAQRRYLLAGAVACLSFLDWQIGGLACLGAVAGALVTGPRRARAATSVALGMSVPALIFLGYLAAHRALRPAFDQAVVSLFSRGADSAHKGVLDKTTRILDNVRVACVGHEWLFVLGLLGMLVFPFWFFRCRDPRRRGLLVLLAVYHYGITAFNLFDYQSYGDLYFLLHTIAFFAVVPLVEVSRRLTRMTPTIRLLAPGAILFGLIVLLRPSLIRSDYRILAPTVQSSATLDDQREVARILERSESGRRLAFVGPAEIAFLTGARNPIPFVFWNPVVHRFYRKGPQEDYQRTTVRRILQECAVDVLILDRTVPNEPGDRWIVSSNGAYRIKLRPLR